MEPFVLGGSLFNGGRAALQGRVKIILQMGFSPGAPPQPRHPDSRQASARTHQRASRLEGPCVLHRIKNAPQIAFDYTDSHGSDKDLGRRDAALLRLISSERR